MTESNFVRRVRLTLMFAWVLGSVACVVWGGVVAQEGGPVFAPPPVLPRKNAPSAALPVVGKQKTVEYPGETLPLHGTTNGNPKLIIPREVYEAPLVLESKKKPGDIPPPNLEKVVIPLNLLPSPAVESKVLTQPMGPPIPHAGAPGVVESETPPILIPPPVPVKPVDIPPPTEKVADPPKEKGPLALPSVELPKQVSPPSKQEIIIQQPNIEAKKPTQTPARPKAFVPIRSGSGVGAAPVSRSIQSISGTMPPLPSRGAPDLVPLKTNALASAQAPSVFVAKQGAAVLRAGQSQEYSIVVRNLGPGVAAKVLVEDDLPANVRIVSADPMPTVQGGRATWVLTGLEPRSEQTFRMLLQSALEVKIPQRLRLGISSGDESDAPAEVAVPRTEATPFKVQLLPPNSIVVGKTGVFKVRIHNQSLKSLLSFVLSGNLPLGLAMQIKDDKGTHEERQIEGKVDLLIAPGEARTLDMPVLATKPGRHTVQIKVTTGGVEASASAIVEVSGDTLRVQQPTTTRMFLGRDGDLRIEVANPTGATLRNIAVSDRLPEGLDFVAASDRGLYQANSRTVFWLLDLPAGESKTLVVRLRGNRAGEHQNIVQVKADGLSEQQSTGVIRLDGVADLSLRVVKRDAVIEVGAETLYDIQITNAGTAAATNVKLEVRFPPGLLAKKAEGGTRYTIHGENLVFDPIASLAGQGTATCRVWVVAQPNADRDQRVRVSIVSDQIRLPIQREVRTIVVPR